MAVAVLVFFLNRNATSELGIFGGHHIPYARALTGDFDRSVISYPMWGYPLIIAVFGTGIWLKLLQLVISFAAFLWIYREWIGDSQKTIVRIGVLILFAWIWFATASVYWPAAIAIPIWWISVTLHRRLTTIKPSTRTALLTGIAAGIVANFRSDFLLLTLFVFTAATLAGLINSPKKESLDKIKSLAIVFAVTLLTLLPWGIYNQINGEGFRLTSSNGGGVATISLGQLPGNSWGITPRDEFLVRYMESNSNETASPFDPTSDRLFWELFIDSIIDDPTEFAKKMLWNLKNSLLGGLYVGDIDTFGGVNSSERLDNWKESLKRLAGLNSNPNPESNSAESSGILSYQLALFVFGVAITAVTALLVIVAIGALILKTKIPASDTSDATLAAIVIGVLILIALFQYQPRHLSTAAPALIVLALPVINHWTSRLDNSRFLQKLRARSVR
jgi:hypothetical protein